MKKSILVCTSAMILVYSCKKENQSNNNKNGQPPVTITGKWSYMQDTVLEYKNGAFSRVISQISNTTANPNDYDLFNADGTGTIFSDSGSVNFTYEISGDKITFNLSAYTITIPDGPTVTEPASTESATIKILTNSSLELFYDDSLTDGSGNVIRDTEAAYYTKQ